MKDKQIEEAIIKGIESKGAIDVGDEIAKAILSENAQNNEFIEAKTTDETPICETNKKPAYFKIKVTSTVYNPRRIRF